MRNSATISLIVVDNISGAHNRGSTTIVTECDRSDILWVRIVGNGALYTHATPTTLFTGHMIHRYQINWFVSQECHETLQFSLRVCVDNQTILLFTTYE